MRMKYIPFENLSKYNAHIIRYAQDLPNSLHRFTNNKENDDLTKPQKRTLKFSKWTKRIIFKKLKLLQQQQQHQQTHNRLNLTNNRCYCLGKIVNNNTNTDNGINNNNNNNNNKNSYLNSSNEDNVVSKNNKEFINTDYDNNNGDDIENINKSKGKDKDKIKVVGSSRKHYSINDTSHEDENPKQVLHIYEEKRKRKKELQYTFEHIAKVGGGINFGLAVLKSSAGLMCGSSGLLASAADSISDLVGDCVLLWALRASRVPANEDRPWGHGRFETVATLGTGCLMLGAGASIGIHSFFGLGHVLHPIMESYGMLSVADFVFDPKVLHQINQEYLVLGMAVAGISVISKEALFRSTVSIANRFGGSKVLEAHANHHRSDALSAVVAVCGLGGAYVGLPVLDAIAGVIVSGVIWKGGFKITRESLSELSDAGLKPGEMVEMMDYLTQIEGVEGIKFARGRRLGPFMELHATVLVDPWFSVSSARDLETYCQTAMQKKFDTVSFCLIRAIPVKLWSTKQLENPEEFIYKNKEDDEMLPLWQSHYRRRMIAEKYIKKVTDDFPEVLKINRITCHRLHVDQGSTIPGFVVTVAIEVDPAIKDMEECKEIATELQEAIQNITFQKDGTRPILECDVHLDLTQIKAEKENWKQTAETYSKQLQLHRKSVNENRKARQQERLLRPILRPPC